MSALEAGLARIASFRRMEGWDGETVRMREIIHARAFLRQLHAAGFAGELTSSPGGDGSVNLEFGEFERCVAMDGLTATTANVLVCRENLTRERVMAWDDAIRALLDVEAGCWPHDWPRVESSEGYVSAADAQAECDRRWRAGLAQGRLQGAREADQAWLDAREHDLSAVQAAILTRDVAEVAFRVGQWEQERASYAKALADCPLLSGSHATWRHEIAVVDRYVADCNAWLVRARAALGRP